MAKKWNSAHDLRCDMKEERDTKRLCEPCLLDSSEQDVSSFCTVCTEFLCTDCTRDHKKNKVTRNHCVLEGNNVPKDSKAFKMMKKMTSCSKHPEMVVSYKCADHDAFICITCLALDHRRCENVSEICTTENQEVSKDIVQELKQKQRELRHYTSSIKSLQEETIRSLVSEQSTIKHQVKQYVDSIIEKLRIMEELFEVETEQVIAKEVAELQQSVAELNKVEEMQSIENNLLDTTNLYGNTIEKSVICSLLLNKTKELETVYKAREKFKDVHLQFEINEALKQIDSLGDVNVVSVLANQDILNKMKTQLEKGSDGVEESSAIDKKCAELKQKSMTVINTGKASMESLAFMQRTVSSATSYRIWNETDDQNCSVCGIVTLPNNQIVIIDSGNRKIKLFTSDFFFAFEVKLNEIPIDICYLINDNMALHDNIALLFDEKKYIKVYGIYMNKILYERSQMMNRFGITISGYKDWEAVILCSDTSRKYFPNNTLLEIQIRNLLDGRGKKIITVDNLLTDVCFDSYRVHCTNNQELYILHNHRLHCFQIISKPSGLDLEEKWFYKSHRILLSDPADVTTDSDGNVYICGQASGNVHQVCGKNIWKNRLVVSGLTAPTTVAVNSRKGEIVVGCKNDDYIHVYTFMS